MRQLGALPALLAVMVVAGSLGATAQSPVRRRPTPRPAADAPAPGDVVAIVGGRILPVSGPAIDRGVVLIAGERSRRSAPTSPSPTARVSSTPPAGS